MLSLTPDQLIERLSPVSNDNRRPTFEMDETGGYPAVPGYLSVLSRPNHTLTLDEYHQWYNTEHGPLRMQLGFFRQGHRYRSRGLHPPVWLAAYDVESLSCFADPQYTTLRENRSSREQHLMKHGLDLFDRRIYQTLSSRGQSHEAAPVIMVVTFVVKKELVDDIHAWYEQVGPLLCSWTWHSLT